MVELAEALSSSNRYKSIVVRVSTTCDGAGTSKKRMKQRLYWCRRETLSGTWLLFITMQCALEKIFVLLLSRERRSYSVIHLENTRC